VGLTWRLGRTPVPDSDTVDGATGSFVTSVKVSLRGPSVTGVYVTARDWLVPGATLKAVVGETANCEPAGSDTLET
jgi:hypothetical protein